MSGRVKHSQAVLTSSDKVTVELAEGHKSKHRFQNRIVSLVCSSVQKAKAYKKKRCTVCCSNKRKIYRWLTACDIWFIQKLDRGSRCADHGLYEEKQRTVSSLYLGAVSGLQCNRTRKSLPSSW